MSFENSVPAANPLNDHFKIQSEDKHIHTVISNAHISENGTNVDEVIDTRKLFPEVFKKSLRIHLERVKDRSIQDRNSAMNKNNEFHGGTENHFFSPKFAKSAKGIIRKALNILPLRYEYMIARDIFKFLAFTSFDSSLLCLPKTSTQGNDWL